MSDTADTLPASSMTALAAAMPDVAMRPFAGVQTPAVFTGMQAELNTLLTGVGVFDQGWRRAIRVTGQDRVRWLNGMVTNMVTQLENGRWNQTFLLNAQGRIQGEAEVYAEPEALLLVTDASQAEALYQHLDRFIIMDEVEMAYDAGSTALGVGGPGAAALVTSLGLPTPAPYAWLQQDHTRVIGMTAQRYTLRVPQEQAAALWERFLAAGALPCGADALEALRVLEGRPQYGADIQERHLVQETGQMQALNFNKGCYLGQEIVERVRSRARLNRAIRSFVLTGAAPEPGVALHSGNDDSTPVGELTSIAAVDAAGLHGIYALGTVRTDAADGALHYTGGSAHPLERAPLARA